MTHHRTRQPSRNNPSLRLGFLCFGITLGLTLFLYCIWGFAPFGDRSLVSFDADVQYLDFFAWLKDILEGKNDLDYTFSRMLGGTGAAIYSYYLSSPLSLLVVFFQKAQLRTFFDLLMAVKLALCGLTSAYYLRCRFPNIKAYLIVLFSLCYAYSTYNLTNGNSIMWLDGVFMLPLVLLGVYRIVSGRPMTLLAAAVGASMLFNWYTGCINCLFSAIWFAFEWALARGAHREKPRAKEDLFAPVLKYAAAMLIGICISMILFLPTWLSLQSSRGVELDLFRLGFRGNPLNILAAYSMGTGSGSYYTTLFCGSLPLLGAMGYFIGEGPSRRKKLTAAAMLLLMVLIFYFQPFYLLFSLLREVFSYYCRFAYGGSLFLIFLAALFYQETKLSDRRLYLLMALCGCVLVVRIAGSLYMGEKVTTPRWIALTAVFLAAVSGAWFFTLRTTSSRGRQIATALTVLLTVLELSCNAWQMFDVFTVEDMDAYAAYQQETQAQIDAVKSYDPGNYRISQTSTRFAGANHLTSYYNDPLAHGYASICGYTSDPDLRQQTLLDHLGYRVNGATYNIINTSVLPADSLLGVRYILSKYEINGLEPVTAIMTADGKKVYRNPFCLPMAFTYSGGLPAEAYDGDPFLYQNAVFSALSGEDTALFIPIPYTAEVSGQSATYTLSLPEGDYAFYGNIPWNREMKGTLNVNDAYATGYSMWTSPSVFYIPADEGARSAEITLDAENALAIAETQFYALDLKRLQSVSQKLAAAEIPDLELENGSISCSAEGSAGEMLFLSVPYSSGWTVTRNGAPIEPELFADCLMCLPLLDGGNEFHLEYTVPGLRAGTLLSALALLALGLCVVGTCRKQKRERMYDEI